jgi:hypothetical protein
MRKAYLGLFFIVVVLSAGCLGNAPDQVVGTWRYVHEVNPLQHDMYWTFQNSDVYFYDATTAQYDTGKYEMYMNGTNRIIKIKGTDIQDANIKMNGEWYIVEIDFDKLIVGTKDQGGFQQRDFTKQ